MLTLKPPPPTRPVETNQAPRKFWTIHHTQNSVFGMRMREGVSTAVVGFAKIDDAILIGRMIDTYYETQKELPSMIEGGKLILPAPSPESEVCRHIYIQTWDFDDLRVDCTKNILNLLTINGLKNTDTGLSVSGTLYMFEAGDYDLYRWRFEQLLPINNDPDDGPYV